MKLSTSTLLRVFLRSLFLQASWNRRGMQNIGFGYAIEPALNSIYPDRAQRQAAMQRHIGLFNCHPYMAASILGGAVHHELRIAEGTEAPQVVLDFKRTLQGPFAAIGDGFFWTAMRPFFGALAAVGSLFVGWIAVAAVLVTYNIIHLVFRYRLFQAGLREGDEVVTWIAARRLTVFADRYRHAASVLCGLFAAVVLVNYAQNAGWLAGLLVAAVAGLGYVALARGAGLLPMAYVAATIGIGVALAAIHLGGRS